MLSVNLNNCSTEPLSAYAALQPSEYKNMYEYNVSVSFYIKPLGFGNFLHQQTRTRLANEPPTQFDNIFWYGSEIWFYKPGHIELENTIIRCEVTITHRNGTGSFVYTSESTVTYPPVLNASDYEITGPTDIGLGVQSKYILNAANPNVDAHWSAGAGGVVINVNYFESDFVQTQFIRNRVGYLGVGSITANIANQGCVNGTITKTKNLVIHPAPETPSNLRIKNLPGGIATLSWDLTSYNEWTAFIVDFNETNQSHNEKFASLSGMVDGTEYRACVYSQGQYINSNSECIEFWYDITPPSSPGNFTIASSTLRTINFTWSHSTDNTGIKKYMLYKEGVFISDIPSTVNSFELKGVAEISATKYTLVSVDLADNVSNVSNEVVYVPPVFIVDYINQKVGIGTSHPIHRLDIFGGIGIKDGYMAFRGNSDTAKANIYHETGDLLIQGHANNIKNTILNVHGGKIGIGVASPVDKLHVKGNVNLEPEHANGKNRITFKGTDLEIFTPVQAQWNGNKPIIEMSQYGEIKFNSTPFLNYNAIYFKGAGGYNNGLRIGDNFGGSSGFEGPILFGENGGALGSSISNQNWSTSGTKTALYWDNNQKITMPGNVGIGTSTPDPNTKLHVVGNARIDGNLIFNGNINMGLSRMIGHNVEDDKFTQGASVVGHYSLGWFNDTWNTYGQTAYLSGYSGIKLFTNGSPRLNIKQDGNVGIGTTDPLRTLHINSPSTDGGIAIFQHGNARLFIDRIDNDNINITNYKINGTYGNIILAHDGGNIGIGTNSPSNKLHVHNGNIYTNQNISAGGNISGANIYASGNVGIGFTNPLRKLHVNDRIRSSQGFELQDEHKGMFYDNNELVLWMGGNALSIDASRVVKISTRIDAPEFRACLSPGTCPDYVFEKSYKLMNLNDLSEYISKNKHLPEVPAAKEMEGSGMDIKQMNLTLLKKVEELTLYILQQNTRLEKQELELQNLKNNK
ncbi:MAG: hypothetical protein NW207_00130 [Cytophagales bacterium]|nr:hypothetical protein [Cytophagales bacterium]